MMSMNTLSSASQAGTYYSKDNYYTKETTAESVENAAWYGKGASVLGLDDKEFDTDRFKELLEGDIDEDNKIGRVTYDENGVAVTQHRPGVDLTFSAPKSVSILSEIFKNKEVRDAHEDAVKATLDQVEDMYAQTRISVDGQMQKVDTKNLIVALFSHNNSRDLDPQTHTHAVVMNATLNEKGEWTALSNEKIYKSQRLIGAIYNSELANNLDQLGYDLEYKENGNFEIAGVPKDAIDEFSQRRKAMIKSAEERGIDLSSASASVREQVALKTRTSKKDVTQESLDNDWDDRAEKLGLSKEYISDLNAKALKNRSERNSETVINNQKSYDVNLKNNNEVNKEIKVKEVDRNNKSKPSNTEKTNQDGVSATSLIDDVFEMVNQKNVNDSIGGSDEINSVVSNSDSKDVVSEKTVDSNLKVKENSLNNRPNSTKSLDYNPLADPPIDLQMQEHEGIKAESKVSSWQSWLNRLWGKDANNQDSKQSKDVSNISNDLEKLSPSEKKVRESVFYAVGHLTEREMMVNKDDVLRVALDHGGAGINIKTAKGEVDRLLKSKILVQGKGEKITTQRMAKSEVWSVDHVKEESFSVAKILSNKDVDKALDEREGIQKYAYTEGQRDALKGIFTRGSRYYSVDGLAGVGKTTMLSGLNKIATDNGFVVKGMSVGGVAAKNLEDETGIPSTTVAMFQLNENKLQQKLENKGIVDRKNEIWVVDESSFTGQHDYSEILKLAKNANSRVVFLGDKLQLQSIAAGKPFEILQDKMAKSEMQNINRQKTKELKDIVSVITMKNKKGEITLSNNQKAFDMLDKQGGVIEHKEEGLHSEMVKDYMSQPLEKRNNTLIITPFNRDRILINNLIREKKKENGELEGDAHESMILINRNLTKAQQTNIKEYKQGDVIRFNKDYKLDEKSKVEKNKYYEVKGTFKNKEGNVKEGLVLEDEKGNRVEWGTKNKNLIEVYEKKKTELQKGDLIKINRSNGEYKNGEKYTFHEFRHDQAVLKNDKGEEKLMPKNDFKHWDHGYANTIYSSQGLTKSSVFMLINSEGLSKGQNQEASAKNLGKIFGNRAFYVGATRASHELKIYTHDKDVARTAISYEQDKSSYIGEGNTLEKNENHVNQKGFDMEF